MLALQKCFAGMDPRTFWPAAASQVEPYFSDYFALDWLQKYRTDRKKFHKALKTLYPSKLRSIFYHLLIPGLKVLKKYRLPPAHPLLREEIINITLTILDVINEIPTGDVFCRDGSYLYWSPDEIKKNLDSPGWREPKNPEEQKFVGGALRVDGEQMVWSTQTDIYRTSASFLHGLYLTPKRKLLVHEFFDLNSHVWNLKSPIPSVRILLLYHPRSLVEFSFDFANHYLINIPKPFSHLAKYKIEFPGGIPRDFHPSSANIDNLFTTISAHQLTVINKLSDTEKLCKMIELGYYQYREFWQSYREDWAPPPEVWERLSEWKLRYWEKGKPNPDKIEPTNRTLKLFDPRNDHYGD